jgi:hypothetical protein
MSAHTPGRPLTLDDLKGALRVVDWTIDDSRGTPGMSRGMTAAHHALAGLTKTLCGLSFAGGRRHLRVVKGRTASHGKQCGRCFRALMALMDGAQPMSVANYVLWAMECIAEARGMVWEKNDPADLADLLDRAEAHLEDWKKATRPAALKKARGE